MLLSDIGTAHLNEAARPQKQEITTEGADKQSPIYKEYLELKKKPLKELKDMIKRIHKVVDVSEYTKETAATEIVRSKHGDKRVDAAFGLSESEEVVKEEAYDLIRDYMGMGYSRAEAEAEARKRYPEEYSKPQSFGSSPNEKPVLRYMLFFAVPAGQEDKARNLGIKQTKAGKWALANYTTSNQSKFADKVFSAETAFGKSKKWAPKPKNESVAEASEPFSTDLNPEDLPKEIKQLLMGIFRIHWNDAAMKELFRMSNDAIVYKTGAASIRGIVRGFEGQGVEFTRRTPVTAMGKLGELDIAVEVRDGGKAVSIIFSGAGIETPSKIENKMRESEGASADEEEQFHQQLDKLVHKTFGKSEDETKKSKFVKGYKNEI